MSKKVIYISIAVIVLIVLVIGGYFGWIKWKDYRLSPEEKALNKAGDVTDTLTEDVSKGVLPPIQVNPLENKPDVNPANKANPFENIKTNPFE